jgi:hypothetical protein
MGLTSNVASGVLISISFGDQIRVIVKLWNEKPVSGTIET